MNKLEKITNCINNNEIQDAYNLCKEYEQEYLNNADYWNLRGLLCLKLDEYDTARKCLEKSLAFNRKNADALFNYAVASEHLGYLSDSALYYGLTYRYTNDSQLREELSQIYNENQEIALNQIYETAAYGNSKTFIIMSSCGWGDIQQRMHHISKSLVKFGHEVIFIEPSVNANVTEGEDNLTVHDLTKYSLDNIRMENGVNVLQPISVIKNRNLINNYADLVQNILHASLHEKPVIITYMPYQVTVLEQITGEFYHIYDCVDDHTDLEYAFWGHKNDVIWEHALMNTADFITTTSTSLYLQRTAIEKRKNVLISKNAVNEVDFITKKSEIPEDIRHIPEPRIVYMGALYEWFDTELFYDVAKANPDKSFVIIGFGKDILSNSLPNLYFIGAKKHSELKEYLSHMQVGIIPFKSYSDIIINCDPIKHYEYIACGLPVVTTYIPDSAIDKPYTFLGNDSDTFSSAIDEALGIKIDSNTISNFLAENSWNSRAALLCGIADGKIGSLRQEEEIEKIGRQISQLSENYCSAIFKTMKAVYLNLIDSESFEVEARRSYHMENTGYTEKQYIRSLIINNNISELLEAVPNLKYVREELKNEIIYRFEQTEYEYIYPLTYLLINDYPTYYKYSRLIQDTAIKKLFDLYVQYIIEVEVDKNEIITVMKSSKGSPVSDYLRDKFSIYEYALGDVLSEEQKDEIESQINEWIEKDNLNSATKLIEQLEAAFSAEDPIFINILKTRLLIKQGGTNEALKFLQLVDRTMPNKRAGLLLAELLDQIGSKFKALKQYSRYVEKSDRNIIKKMELLLEESSDAKISLISTTNSGCNSIGLLRGMPNYIRERYEVRLFQEQRYEDYDSFVKESDVVVTTQANYPFNHKQINIELWHGFPLKAMANMDPGDLRSAEQLRSWWEKVDYITSYSGMFNTLFNACIGLDISKYQVTGAPRNDLLSKNYRSWFAKLFESNLDGQNLIMFTPTFRSSQFNPTHNEGDRNWGNLFGFEEFNQEEFESYLEEKKIYLIVKLHWVEETIVKEQIENFNSNRIKLLTEDEICASGLDLYELLSSIDLLITDYSSIYFDYLLLDRPVLFTPVDLKTYEKKRGFLLEPYETWTPGPKVTSQNQLQVELSKLLSDRDYYLTERNWIKNIIHTHTDFCSAERVWELIDNELNLDAERKLVHEMKLHLKLDEIKDQLIIFMEKAQLKQFDDMLSLNRELVEQSSELNTIAATSYYSRGDLEAALYYLLQAYSIDSSYFDALYSLAIIYEQLGQANQSGLFYQKAAAVCMDKQLKEELTLKSNILNFTS